MSFNFRSLEVDYLLRRQRVGVYAFKAFGRDHNVGRARDRLYSLCRLGLINRQFL